jgi:hypothetical protein
MQLLHPARRHRGLVFTALVFASGCAAFRGHGAATKPAVLVFTNETIDQAAVFCTITGGGAVRIGTVIPGHTDTLYLPPAMTGAGGAINITARLLGRTSVAQTGQFSIAPGELLLVRLPADGKALFVTPP